MDLQFGVPPTGVNSRDANTPKRSWPCCGWTGSSSCLSCCWHQSIYSWRVSKGYWWLSPMWLPIFWWGHDNAMSLSAVDKQGELHGIQLAETLVSLLLLLYYEWGWHCALWPSTTTFFVNKQILACWMECQHGLINKTWYTSECCMKSLPAHDTSQECSVQCATVQFADKNDWHSQFSPTDRSAKKWNLTWWNRSLILERESLISVKLVGGGAWSNLCKEKSVNHPEVMLQTFWEGIMLLP
jgi:hypothetical protein